MSVFPHLDIPHFKLYLDSMMSWRCPKCSRKGGHWYIGEVMPKECVMNALYADNCSRTLSSSELSWE